MVLPDVVWIGLAVIVCTGLPVAICLHRRASASRLRDFGFVSTRWMTAYRRERL
jgi:hypothetical protein